MGLSGTQPGANGTLGVTVQRARTVGGSQPAASGRLAVLVNGTPPPATLAAADGIGAILDGGRPPELMLQADRAGRIVRTAHGVDVVPIDGRSREDWLRAGLERARMVRGLLVRDDVNGHYLRPRAGLRLGFWKGRTEWQRSLLAWLRDHVDRRIPSMYYRALLGHDLHLSVWGDLQATHWHASERDPFTGELGWLENIGLVSAGKVTTALRDYEIDNLVSLDTTGDTYGTFKYHEVGTDATAESNAHTALIATSGIARAVGTQVEAAADQYRSVGSVTADATETWQEHGLFNASSGPVLADRSLISPTIPTVANDIGTFTYTMTKTAEA